MKVIIQMPPVILNLSQFYYFCNLLTRRCIVYGVECCEEGKGNLRDVIWLDAWGV